MALETEGLHLDSTRLRTGIQALLQDESKGFYLIAEVAGRRTGQMMITYEWSDWRNGTFWWIQSVFVDPNLRGRGVFRALYRYVEQAASADPAICGLRLYVETANERAQKTYLSAGMQRARYEFFEVDYVIERKHE